MKISSYIVLLVIVVMLAVTVVVAQVAFRIERTVLSYRFTYDVLQETLAPLDDPEIHAEAVGEAFSFVRRSLSFQVPRELEPYIIESAIEGFSASWVKQSMGLWLLTTQQALHGGRETIEYPLSLGPFKSAFLSNVRGQFTQEEQFEINVAVDEIPTTVDLAEELPEGITRRIVALGRSMSYGQILLQYVLPGLFMIGCLFHRRIGTGLSAMGLGFLAAGIPSIVMILRGPGIARRLGNQVSRSVPDFASWIGAGIESGVREVIASGLLTAVLVTVSGALMLAAGLFLWIRKGDPRIPIGGS